MSAATVRARPGTAEDLPALVAILNHHISAGFATFDEVATTVADRRPWFARFAATGPYRIVVADVGREVAGHACSVPYRDHSAFRRTVELSVYVSPLHTGRGVGTLLYERVLAELADEDVHRAVVGIALPNDASIALHRRFGFTDVGVFDEYATKRGRMLSSLWMQRRC